MSNQDFRDRQDSPEPRKEGESSSAPPSGPSGQGQHGTAPAADATQSKATGQVPESTAVEPMAREPEAPEEGSRIQPGHWALRKGPAIAIVLALVLFLVIISGYILSGGLSGPDAGDGSALELELDPAEAMELRVFFPVSGRVALERRQIRRLRGARETAVAAIGEFLKGPSVLDDTVESYVPPGVELLGVYLGDDKVLYMDFSSSLSLNFRGDAVAEFLFLRALYRTLKENVYGISEFKVLVDGQEVDTVGGHIYITGGLGTSVPYRLLKEDGLE